MGSVPHEYIYIYIYIYFYIYIYIDNKFWHCDGDKTKGHTSLARQRSNHWIEAFRILKGMEFERLRVYYPSTVGTFVLRWQHTRWWAKPEPEAREPPLSPLP